LGEIISMRFEQFREWLAFKIYPDLHFYMKLNKTIGELNENKRIVKLIEQSKFKNKKAVIDLVETKFVYMNSLKQTLDDAFEDQTSSDAS
jgi:hypothetical protein